MKKTLIILVLFPILISFNSYGGSSDKTVCVETDAQIRDDIIYLPNETEPFTGNNLCKYENGQIKSKGEIKDGRPEGKFIEWYENGQIWREATIKNDELDGKQTGWYENGQIEFEQHYKDGKEVGETKYAYNEKGQIEQRKTTKTTI